MNEILTNLIGVVANVSYILLTVAAVTLPIWGYKLLEKKISNKHKALRVSEVTRGSNFSIIASIGTTTSGVFLIQILPLIFSMINDVGGQFAVNTVYSDHMMAGAAGDFVGDFMGLSAELGGIMQDAAPMAAVGLGGYNLLTNLSRGLPAIWGAKKA